MAPPGAQIIPGRVQGSPPRPNRAPLTHSASMKAVTKTTSLAGPADQSLKAAPVHAPRRRLDETLAARKPVLTYREPEAAEAAE